MARKKITNKLIVAAAILLASGFTVLQSVEWKVKDGYSVKADQYSFSGLKAMIRFDETNPEKSRIIAYIDSKTINTGNKLKDAHAREALDVDKFPLISFTSTEIKKANIGYEATGDLTIKGIVKEIKISFIFDSKKISDRFPFVDKETFSGTFTIIPKEFNITRAGTPDHIMVELNIPVSK